MLSLLAKGTKKEKSSFGGALDLFYRGKGGIVFRRTGLHLLTAFRGDDAGNDLRAELPRFYAACHLLEVLTGMTREEEPCPELFDTVSRGLAALGAAAPSEVPSVLFATLLDVLEELGFAPSLHRCATCGRLQGGKNQFLSPSRGGILCGQCRREDPRARAVPAGVTNALRALARTPPERAGRIRLSGADREGIRAFLTAFVEWRLERPLRTARFL